MSIRYKPMSNNSLLRNRSSASIKPSVGANFESNLIAKIDTLFQFVWNVQLAHLPAEKSKTLHDSSVSNNLFLSPAGGQVIWVGVDR